MSMPIYAAVGVALVAGLFGFGGMTGLGAMIAQGIFFVALVISVAVVGMLLAGDAKVDNLPDRSDRQQ